MFLFLKYCHTHFSPYFAKKKNMVTFYIFDQNRGLTPGKDPHFSIFLTSLFYSLESIFYFQNIAKHISFALFYKKKNQA